MALSRGEQTREQTCGNSEWCKIRMRRMVRATQWHSSTDGCDASSKAASMLRERETDVWFDGLRGAG